MIVTEDDAMGQCLDGSFEDHADVGGGISGSALADTLGVDYFSGTIQ